MEAEGLAALPLWLQLLFASLTGGVVVKLLDIGQSAIQSARSQRRNAKTIVDKHLDPLLKAADDLVGKVRSLAETDFDDFKNVSCGPQWKFNDNVKVSSLLFLIAAFWCRVELLRRESHFVELKKDVRGRLLLKFFDCLESRRVRILDRITQRAIGELLIPEPPAVVSAGFVRLATQYETDASVRRWLQALLDLLVLAHRDKQIRQRILLYGTILQAMTDTIDPKNEVAKSRPAYPNKLARREREMLRRGVFRVYVPEVKDKEKYYRV